MDIETESALLRQEHRAFHIIKNVLSRKTRYPNKDDDRRAACVIAFAWFLVPAAILTGGGLLAIASAVLLYRQNALIQESNLLLAKSINPGREFTLVIEKDLYLTDGQPAIGDVPEILHSPNSKLEIGFTHSVVGKSPMFIESIDASIKFANASGQNERLECSPPHMENVDRVVEPGKIVHQTIAFNPYYLTTPAHETPNQFTLILDFLARDVDGNGWACSIEREVQYQGGGSGVSSELGKDGSPEGMRFSHYAFSDTEITSSNVVKYKQVDIE